jgi:hypothetical protein
VDSPAAQIAEMLTSAVLGFKSAAKITKQLRRLIASNHQSF